MADDYEWANDARTIELAETLASLREQVRTLTAQVEDWKSAAMLDVGGDPDGVTPDMLRADLVKRDAEVRTLAADNAALMTALNGADGHLSVSPCCRTERKKVRTLLAEPHPGAALLAEMDALRARVAELEAALADRITERDIARRARDDAQSERDSDQQRAKALEERFAKVVAKIRTFSHAEACGVDDDGEHTAEGCVCVLSTLDELEES